MKKAIIAIAALFICGISFAQLTGTKNIPGDYPTLAAAISDLNTQGVGATSVTLNLISGNPQTAPAGGYVIGGSGSAVLTTTRSSSQVIIEGNGNVITAYSPQATGSISDAIFKIIGGDFITIRGFVMQENSANTTIATAATNNMTEFGVAVFYVTTTDGAKNNTIRNNTIGLNKLYRNSFGIYSSVRHSPASMTVAADIADVAGSNESLHIYSNTISGVNEGIVVVGSATAAYTNTDIDVGGSSAATGNTISNYGTASCLSSFVSLSSLYVPGIWMWSNLNSNVSWNSVTCPGLNTANNMYGILWQSQSFSPAPASVTTNITSHNSISVKNGIVTGAEYGIRYEPYVANHNFIIEYNDFHDFGWNNVTGTTGIAYGISLSSAANFATVANNTFTNLTLNTAGDVHLIREASLVAQAGSTKTITGNMIVTGLTKTQSGGTVYCYNGTADNSGVGSVSVDNNNFSNILLTGTTALTGFTVFSQAPVKSIHDNVLSNVSGGSGTLTGLTSNYNSADIYSNTFSNLSGGGAISVMTCGGTGATLQNVYANTIHGIVSSGTTTVYGIQSLASGANSVSNLYRNSVQDLSTSGSTLYGIYVSAGTTINTYNNMVGDLRAPSANAALPLVGIYLGGGTANNVFFNTACLAGSSTGALFGSSALYATTTTALDLRNNILVNTSVPTGAGVTSAFRRSNATLTTYAATSDANDYYAGASEDATHAVYYDGAAYDIVSFKALVASRDALSFRELPPFINTATTPWNLHLSLTTATQCESGALQVTAPFAVTDDFDGTARSATPDVGADEFAGIAGGIVNPGAFTASAVNSQQINLTFTPNQSGNPVVIVWNLTGTFTAPAGVPPAAGGSLANGTVLYQGYASPFSHTGRVPGTTYYYKAFSYAGSGYSGGTTANAAPGVAPPAAFSAHAVSSARIDLNCTLNAQAQNVIVATGGSASFGTPVNGTAYPAGSTLPGGATVIYSGPLANFSHTGLSPVTTYYYSVWSVDGFNYYSSSVAANATTFCIPVTAIPWFEGFENMTATGTNILPSCWSYANISGSGYSCSATCNENSAQGGSKFIGGSWNFDVWDFTPGIQLNGGTSYDFKFWLKTTNNIPGYNLTLAYGTLPESASMTGVVYSENGVYGDTWTQKTLTFTPASSGVYFFGLHNVGYTGAAGGIAFDDFSIQESSPCFVSTQPSVSNVTTSSATLAWMSSGSAWEYAVIPTGTYPAGSGTPAVSNPAVVSGLSAGTSYDFYIRTNCSGTYSSWTGPVTFMTQCAVYSAPFAQTFANPSLPPCWTLSGPQNWELQHVNPAPWYGATFVTDHTPGMAGNYAWVDGSSGTPGMTGITLVSPEISVASLTSPRIRFFLFNNNVSSASLADEQQLRADVWDGAAWHNGAFLWAYGQNAPGWQEQSISLASYSITGPVRVRFVVDKGSGLPAYDDLLIDDVTVEETPACLYPQNPEALPGNVFSTLDWTPGGSGPAWDIEWGPAGFVPGTGTLISNIQRPYTLQGLTPVTAYSYYVRGNCGTGFSTWTGPKNFVTLVSCPAPAALAATNLLAHSAELSWTETGTAVSWDIEWGPDGFVPGSGTTVSGIGSIPYQLSGLNAGTTYAFYVRAGCGQGSVSEWAGPYAFTTACSVITSWPWTEGFENLTGVGSKILPPCMTYQNVTGTQGPTSTNLTTIWYGPHNGNQSIYTNSYNSTCVFSPAMSLSAGVSYDFSFWMMNKLPTSPVDFTMDVAYGSTNSLNGMTQVLASSVPCDNDHYAKFKYSFTPAASGIYYMGIRTTSLTPLPHAVSFDDFRFEPTPPCDMPLSLAVNAVTLNSAIAAWTGATEVQFEYGPAGHVPGTGTFTAAASASPFTISGLAPATTYDLYVRTSCGAGLYSPWQGPIPFTTSCVMAAAPIFEGFEQLSFTPGCWTRASVAGSSAWTQCTSASGYGIGSRSAVAAFYSQTAGNTYDLITLPFDITGLAAPVLQFDYAYAAFNGELDEMDVYISTDYGLTYTLLLAMPGGTNGILNTAGTLAATFTPTMSQWGTQRLTLPAGTNRVRFRAVSAYGNNLYLDNVRVGTPVEHDAAAVNLSLNDVVAAGTQVPVAIVRNEGKNTETFDVTLAIGSYLSTRTVTSLAANSSATVTFDAWTKTIGSYTATLTTALTGDQDASNDIFSKVVRVMDLNKTVYGYMASHNASPDPNGPVTFSLATPGSITSIANQSPMTSISSGTWANGTWYATTSEPPLSLITLNPATGARTLVGLMPMVINGLSFNPANGTLYGVRWNGSHSELYTISMINGSVTYIGDCGPHYLINLAINNAGQAYSVDIVSDLLGTVSLSTGFFTPVGPVGFDANYSQDMEFDRGTGNLYMTANSTATSWLALVDLSTGKALKIGDLEGNAEISGFAIPYVPAPLSVTALTVNATCPESADGSIALTVAGGTPAYGFLWSTGSTLQNLSALAPGTYSVTVTDAHGAFVSGSWAIDAAGQVCNTQSVTGTVSANACYNALQTLTVAGLTVAAPNGHVELIAGQQILIGPGTVVQPGAWLYGHISTTYCSVPPPVMAAASTEESLPVLPEGAIVLYPNPTSGDFTVVSKGMPAATQVEVYGMDGARIVSMDPGGNTACTVRFADRPAGLYLVRVTAGNLLRTFKLIKGR